MVSINNNENRNIETNLLVSGQLLSTLIYSYAFVFINKILMSVNTINLITSSRLLTLGLTIGVSYIFTMDRFKYKLFRTMLVLETVLYGCITVYIIYTKQYNVYMIIDAIVFSTATESIKVNTCSLVNDLFTKEQRRKYDMKIKRYTPIASFIGLSLLYIIKVDISIAFIIGLCGISVDNIFTYTVYTRYIKTIK